MPMLNLFIKIDYSRVYLAKGHGEASIAWMESKDNHLGEKVDLHIMLFKVV